MFLSDLSIKRPVLVTMFLLVFVLFGALAYFSIPIGLFPDIKIPFVMIETIYPGAGPLVMESQVTKRIEDEIAALGELDSITSFSMEGISFVQVQFKLGKDENIAVQEVKDKVDPILNRLPSGAQKPSISKLDFNSFMPVMSIVMEGSMESTELRTLADTVVKERIAQIEGVGRVSIAGGQEREIRVEFDKRVVFEHSLSLVQIAGLLGAANMEMPGGTFRRENQDISVRLKGEFENLEDLKNLDIPTRAGIRKLRELALVRDGGKEVRQRTVLFDRADGLRKDNVMVMQVIKIPSGNTVKIVRDIQKRLPEIEKELGNRVSLKVISEDATFVQNSVDDTMTNIVLGILLTGLILLFFLHDIRSTFIVAVAMPYSIISTLMIMKIMGISFNILSLMGLSTATGILVANSVVVLENIFRHKELGHNRVDSAGKGTSEVTIAVLASTLTNIAVFLPLANMAGMMGVVLSNFAYTVVIATVFSILVSFTLTPLLASRILPDSVKKELWISRKLEGIFKAWEGGYKNLLKVTLHGRLGSFIVVLITAGVIAVAVVLAGRLQFEMMPMSDGGRINVAVELPQGYDLDSTATVLAVIEERVRRYDEVKTVLTSLGQLSFLDRDVNMATMTIVLVGRGERARGHIEISADITRRLSDIPNAVIRVSPVSETGGGGEAPIDFFLRGPDMETLQSYAIGLSDGLRKIPGLMNVNASSRPGRPEITLLPDRKRVSEEGITIQDLAMSLRAAMSGLVMTTYKEGGNEYDIRVALKETALETYQDLRNIPVATPKGSHPISYFADLQFTESYSKIQHTDKYKTIQFTAFLLPGYTQGDLIGAVEAAVKEMDLPEQYFMIWAGDTEAFQETTRELLTVFVLAVVLTYMLLAASLENFLQPLLILGTVPLSFIGVVLACVFTGTTMNALSMLSVIMLVGIVVNNAILILDYANQLRRKGMDVREALIEACPTKLKPIIMSNLATILGMLPMALGIGSSGAEFRQPMGVVSIGGLVSSTLLTLFVIPAVENLTARHKKKQET
jgi:HAE1 family hydrophobic/amphiphilic exporter-1